MASIADLYYFAETHNIIIDDTFRLKLVPAMSCALDNGLCIVGLHKKLRGRALREQLAHEIGHCVTGAFYNEKTPCLTRGQCEHRAYKWQVHKLLPISALRRAVKGGCREVWQLAEHFSVSEQLVRRALEIYKEEGESLYDE